MIFWMPISSIKISNVEDGNLPFEIAAFYRLNKAPKEKAYPMAD